MFKNTLAEIFPFVQRMYDVNELILVGSDIASWLDIVSSHDLEKVHYINQSAQDYRFETLPLHWQASSKLLAKEDSEINFYTLSNPMLNGTVSSDIFINLWQNLETFETTQKESISLKNFIKEECIAESSKMLVLDSFDGLNVLSGVESLKVDVVALRVVVGDEEAFENVSEQKVQQYLQEYGYKKIASYEDNHPKIKTAVYVLDHKKQSKTLQNEKQSLEEKLQAVPELENKTKTLEESIHKEKTAKEATQKELAELKTQLEDKTKELTVANQIKEKELVELRSELEIKNKTLQEKQLNSEQLQKQYAELNTKVKTLQNEKQSLEEKLQELTDAKTRVDEELQNSLNTNDDDIEAFINDLVPFYYGKSMSYVDAGAFTGEVFLKFKEHLPIREAYLFEPNPKSFEKLTQNISNINIPKLHQYNIALSDKTEELTFSSENSMTKKVDINLDVENEEGYFKVESFKLSKFRKVFTDQKISLLKIDVEGSELSVLSGAKKFLEKHAIDVIYIEVGFGKNNTQQTYFVDIDNFLQNYGYRIYKVYEQVNEWIDDSPLLRRSNIAYMNETFALQNSLKLVQENYRLKQKLDGKKD